MVGFFLFDLLFFRLHLSDSGPYSGSLVCALLAGAGPFWGGRALRNCPSYAGLGKSDYPGEISQHSG